MALVMPLPFGSDKDIQATGCTICCVGSHNIVHSEPEDRQQAHTAAGTLMMSFQLVVMMLG